VKRALLILGWLGCALSLYLGLVALDFYWNVPDWQPRFDGIVMGIFAPITLSILGVAFLSRCSKDRLTKSIAVLLCLALVGLAVYVIPPEPLKPGFLGRESSSPLWYRLGRLGLTLSLCFLLLRTSRKSQPD
jgi:hypothetical protein